MGGDFINRTILKTTNGGQDWQPQNSGSGIKLLSVYFTDNQTGWAVGYNGTIIKTTNGGDNWEAQISNTSFELWSVYFSDNQTGWAVGEDLGKVSIEKTTNGGEEWISFNSGIIGSLFSVHFTDNQTGWAVGWNGIILKTTNGGENWGSQYSGTSIILRSVYFIDNQTGWAVGQQGTILKTVDGGGPTPVDEDKNTNLLNSYLLYQNYPNPFNPSTKIKYQLPERGLVTLNVYDVLGNEVATLVNEEKSSGEYEVKFDGTGLPSGIYFYRLQAGAPSTGSGQGFVETKKMILLR